MTNPADAKVGEFFEVKVVLEGQPYTGPVWATYDGFVTEYENTYAYYTEAESGTAFIKTPRPASGASAPVRTACPASKGPTTAARCVPSCSSKSNNDHDGAFMFKRAVATLLMGLVLTGPIGCCALPPMAWDTASQICLRCRWNSSTPPAKR